MCVGVCTCMCRQCEVNDGVYNMCACMCVVYVVCVCMCCVCSVPGWRLKTCDCLMMDSDLYVVRMCIYVYKCCTFGTTIVFLTCHYLLSQGSLHWCQKRNGGPK